MNDGEVDSGSLSEAFLDMPPLSVVTASSGPICYREVRGPPGAQAVVLLHGIFATAALNWRYAFAPLGKHFRVVAPDLCGHGGDVFARGRFTLEHCADDVAELIALLKLERAIVVGYSMGGMVAQHVGRRHGGRIGGLVLSGVDWGSRQYGCAAKTIGPAFTELSMRFVYMQVKAVRAATKLLVRLGGVRREEREEGSLRTVGAEMGGHNPRAIGGAVRDITRFNSLDWLHEIRVPTAVLVTLRDNLFPQREQRRMAEVIERATVHEFDGGHVAPLQPDFALALTETCRELSARLRSPRRRGDAARGSGGERETRIGSRGRR